MLAFFYRIWSLVRVLAFVTIALSPLNDIQQSVGIIFLVIGTILLESFTEPRTTRFMSYLDRLEELVICFVVGIGLLASGELVGTRRARLCFHPCFGAATEYTTAAGFRVSFFEGLGEGSSWVVQTAVKTKCAGRRHIQP